MIEEDSSLENALAEVERLHVSNKHLEYRLNIVSNERKAMLSTLRREQRKVDRLEAKLRAFMHSKTNIRLDAQINQFEETYGPIDVSLGSNNVSMINN